MSQSAEFDKVLLHISGRDRTGVTAALCGVAFENRARILDLGQSLLHGFLTLSAIIEIPAGSTFLLKALTTMGSMGFHMEVSALPSDTRVDSRRHNVSLTLSMLGDLKTGEALSRITRFLKEQRCNIQEITTWISRGELLGITLTLEPDDPQIAHGILRSKILELGADIPADLAVQVNDIYRLNRRMVVFDVDSTFVTIEVIDELAQLLGIKDRVAEITERAMRGELPFRQALIERVALLKGLDMNRAQSLLSHVNLTPGTEHLVKTLKTLGFRVGLVSGGFSFFVNSLKEKFALDFAFSNELEIHNGVLTGRMVGSIVDAERKAQVLRDMAQVYQIRMEQTVAVGDGANDIEMLKAAGLGIAFRGKKALKDVADGHFDATNMDSVLYLLGLSADS